MKSFLKIATVFFIGAALSACGQDSSNKGSSNAIDIKTSVDKTIPEKTLAPGELEMFTAYFQAAKNKDVSTFVYNDPQASAEDKAKKLKKYESATADTKAGIEEVKKQCNIVQPYSKDDVLSPNKQFLHTTVQSISGDSCPLENYKKDQSTTTVLSVDKNLGTADFSVTMLTTTSEKVKSPEWLKRTEFRAGDLSCRVEAVAKSDKDGKSKGSGSGPCEGKMIFASATMTISGKMSVVFDGKSSEARGDFVINHNGKNYSFVVLSLDKSVKAYFGGYEVDPDSFVGIAKEIR